MSDRPVILVVGGGLAGTLVAARLLDLGTAAEVVVVEPRPRTGPGLAYSTTDDQHLMNVPAHVLGADPRDTDGFVDWLASTGRPVEPGAFVPRSWYGDYLAAHLADAHARAAARGGILRGLRDEVVDLRRSASGWSAHLASGATIHATQVVLALGSPTGPDQAARRPGEFSSPWEPGALDPLDGGTALLVGTGLTAVDAALSLTAADPAARVVAVSSRALLPHRHTRIAASVAAVAPAWPAGGPRTADELADGFEHAAAATREQGGDWRGVVDLIRPTIPDLWANLDTSEQARFLREHARCWELHRHRMAPQVADRVDALRADGDLELRAARVEARPEPSPDGRLRVTLTPVAPDTEASTIDADRVVWCTGVDRDIRTTKHPLLRALLDRGTVASDPHGLGIRATADGAVLDHDGSAQDDLAVLGHLRRGERYESTAVVEIRDQAETIAATLARTVAVPAPEAAR